MSQLGTWLVRSAGQIGLGLTGAVLGGRATYTPSKGGDYDFSALSALPGAMAGAVVAPVGYKLVAPVVRSVYDAGFKATAANLPALLGGGALAAGPIAGAVLVGAVVGGRMTYVANSGGYIDLSGLSALPGGCVGAILAPVVLTGTTAALGPLGGGVAFAGAALLTMFCANRRRN